MFCILKITKGEDSVKSVDEVVIIYVFSSPGHALYLYPSFTKIT